MSEWEADERDGRLLRAAASGDVAQVRELLAAGASANGGREARTRPLHWAAERGHADVVRLLLDRGAEVDAVSENGATALVLAAMKGHASAVRVLVDSGADVNVTLQGGRTPLSSALAKGGGFHDGHFDVVRCLVDAGADVSAAMKGGASMLSQVAKWGDVNAVRCLVDCGASVNALDDYGRTPLHASCRQGHADVVRVLIEHGADVNASDIDGLTPLMRAAVTSRRDVVEHLIECGALVDTKSADRSTALMLAAKSGMLNQVEYLSGAGADVSAADDDGWTPLLHAADGGFLDVVQFLANNKANIDVPDSFGSTPLMRAAQAGHVDIMRFLIDHNANVNSIDMYGWTPLIRSAKDGRHDAVKFLLGHGADVNATDNYGRSSLMMAARGGHLEVVKHLCGHGGQMDVVDKYGSTALMLATRGGYLSVVQFLVDNGADVNAVDLNGESAVLLASRHGYPGIQRLLIRHASWTAAKDAQSSPTITVTLASLPKWYIAPFEVEANQFDDTGIIGGEFRGKWLDADVVLKLFVPDASNTTFADEVRVWHQLRHPNVIKLYGACNVGHHFFVCEFAGEGSVVEYLSRCNPNHRTPWRYLHHAVLGLAYLHERGIFHGNLHGDNILVGDDGLAKLTGFGLSGSSRDAGESNTFSRGFTGLLRWQSPEQLEGERSSFASDIYSFGLCVVQLLTGDIPWATQPLWNIEFIKSQWCPETSNSRKYDPADIPEDIRALIVQMCALDPDNRISASNCVRICERWAADEEVQMQASETEMEPKASISTFADGNLLKIWTDIQHLASTGEKSLLMNFSQALQSVFMEIERQPQPRELLEKLYQLLTDLLNSTQNASHISQVLRLSSIRTSGDSLYGFRRRIGDIEKLLGMRPNINALSSESSTSAHSSEERALFISEISKTWMVLGELQSDEERCAFLTWLDSEIKHPKRHYTDEQMESLYTSYNKMLAEVGSGVGTSMSAPIWFIPWYELLVDDWQMVGSGGFGSVFRAKWLDSDVVVKRAGSCVADISGAMTWSMSFSMTSRRDRTVSEQSAKQDEERSVFVREADIWFNLSHPHVVRLFGACHIGQLFFVCEYAANGSLDRYLEEHPHQIWQKLYEAALGLQYLHERGVVHCDLKCNNIVVGRDGKAKVTDFGLSLAATTATENRAGDHITGAWHWLAPELLSDQDKIPTFASDVFSFGMCIIEALRVVADQEQDSVINLPWQGLSAPMVKYNVTHGKLPMRPSGCTDAQWSLVEKLCRFEPSERLQVCSIVDELATFINPEASTIGSFGTDMPSVLDSMKRRLERLEVDGGNDASSSTLINIYKLLLARVVDVQNQRNFSAQAKKQLEALVSDFQALSYLISPSEGTLVEFTELALKGYALHRRLDKLILQSSVAISGVDGQVTSIHKWKERCYSYLGVCVEDGKSADSMRISAK